MRIYIAGPYSAPKEITDPTERTEKIVKNINDANKLALSLIQKGHTPFVPHTMMRDWEDGKPESREKVLTMCSEWIAQCDALFFFGESPGANEERRVALSRKLPIYDDIDKVPNANDLKGPLSEDLREVRLAEYTQCANSYGHTYQTMWSAGTVFFAITGGILAVLSRGATAITFTILAIALLPILFWFFAIFRPMNRYGDIRRDRLAKIEELFNGAIDNLQMRHFSDENISRPYKKFFIRLGLGFGPKPRVSYYVRFLGWLIFLYEIAFLVCHVLQSRGTTSGWVTWAK